MKRFASFPLAVALIAGFALSAGATQYPPGPGGSCPDTLTLQQIQNPLAVCHPASGDTVYGIRGIVTGFDKDFSPFNFWIQSTNAPWSGAQVFTGATNYFSTTPSGVGTGGVALGDEIVMYGRSNEFNQVTQLLDFDNSQSTNDIIIRRTSTGNALPAFRIVTSTEIDWVPTKSEATAEQWEGMLVRVRGPITVRRTAGPGVGSRSFLATTGVASPDTFAVDGFALTNVTAPPVGTVIDSVQGILTQVTISSISSYRIQLRDASDLFVALPPNLSDAYPVEDNIIRVVFDRDVTEASAENVNNYSLGSLGLVNSATLVGGSGRIVLLNVTNGLADGDNESVTVSGVVSTGGLAMTGPQVRNFVNGVLTIAAIQSPDPTGLGECNDRTRFVNANGTPNQRVSYRGTVVAQFGSVYYLSENGIGTAAPRSGLPVFGVPQTLVVGRKYLLAGQMQEFDGISTSILDGLTEGVTVVYVQDEGPSPVPNPVVQTIPVLSDTTCDAAQNITNAEDFEAVLVTVKNARVLEEPGGPGEPFIIGTPYNAPTDTMLVTNSNSAWSFDADSMDIVNVTGLLTYRNAGFAFRLLPRRNSDIRIVGNPTGVEDGDIAALSFAVTNPARTPRVTFALPREANVDLGVFDVTGRRMATLARGTLDAGLHSRDWSGDLGNGRVASGVYFYKLTVDGETRTIRGVKLN
jgi:hypothetical protein